MYNNCKAMRAGTFSYTHLRHAAVLGPKSKGSVGGGNAGGNSSIKTTLAGINSNKHATPLSSHTSNTDTAATSASSANSAEIPIMGTHSTHTEGAIIALAFGMSG